MGRSSASAASATPPADGGGHRCRAAGAGSAAMSLPRIRLHGARLAGRAACGAVPALALAPATGLSSALGRTLRMGALHACRAIGRSSGSTRCRSAKRGRQNPDRRAGAALSAAWLPVDAHDAHRPRHRRGACRALAGTRHTGLPALRHAVCGAAPAARLRAGGGPGHGDRNLAESAGRGPGRRPADGAGQCAPVRAIARQGEADAAADARSGAKLHEGAGADRCRCRAHARGRCPAGRGHRQPQVRLHARSERWSSAVERSGPRRAAARSCSSQPRARAKRRCCSTPWPGPTATALPGRARDPGSAASAALR